MDPPAFDDPRVPLAAERTLLAWTRTGLALIGLGFVVARFALFLHELAAARPSQPLVPPPPTDGGAVWIGAGMVALGAGVLLAAAVRHVRLIRRLAGGGPYRPAVWSLGVGVTLLLAALGVALSAYLLTKLG